MPQRRRRLQRIVLPLFASVVTLGLTPCHAADWVFRRSYFNVAVPPEQAADYPIPRSLSAYRPAIVSPYPGFSVQSVQRFNHVAIPSGASMDYTLLRSENVRQMP